MRSILIACALAGLSLAAYAEPETYTIDSAHSAARFGYGHLGWTFQQHRFDKLSGKLVLDRVAQTASAEVVIDATSLNTGSRDFNDQLQQPGFFNTAAFPSISFTANQARFEGDQLVSIAGELTIKGIRKPVTLTLTSFVVGPHPVQKRRTGLGANAVATVKRSDFGMSNQVPLVADEVSLVFTVQAFKDL